MNHNAAGTRLSLLPAERSPRPAPVSVDAEVIRNDLLCDRYRQLRLGAPTIAARAQPGQFVMLTASRLPGQGPVLPRPMAIAGADARKGEIDVVYGVVGEGTRQLTTFSPGERMVAVGPLGRGFDVPATAGHAVLIGRGVGTCSLTLLAARLILKGWRVTALSSARSAEAQFGPALYPDAVSLLCADDATGSSAPGAVSALLEAAVAAERVPTAFIAACGSHRLEQLAAHLGRERNVPVQVSVEAHMACGLGYCHGCASRSGASETPLVCVDGPVFAATPHDVAGD